METNELVKLLQEFFKGDIATDDATLTTYSHDTSLFELRPQVVVYPKSKDDIKNLVTFVNQHKAKFPHLSLTPRSGGTDMSGGAINDSIIMDFTRYFKEIGEIKEEGTYVEPGVFYRDFEKKARRHGLLFPSYPASKMICAMGGQLRLMFFVIPEKSKDLAFVIYLHIVCKPFRKTFCTCHVFV